MTKYIENTRALFPEKLSGTANHPWGEKLFQVNEAETSLDDNKQKVFHTMVMKLMFLAKRGRPHILPGVGFLSTRVKNSTKEDWAKLKNSKFYIQHNWRYPYIRSKQQSKRILICGSIVCSTHRL